MAFVLFSSTHLSVFISSLGEKDVNLVENNKLTCRLILFYLLWDICTENLWMFSSSSSSSLHAIFGLKFGHQGSKYTGLRAISPRFSQIAPVRTFCLVIHYEGHFEQCFTQNNHRSPKVFWALWATITLHRCLLLPALVCCFHCSIFNKYKCFQNSFIHRLVQLIYNVGNTFFRFT